MDESTELKLILCYLEEYSQRPFTADAGLERYTTYYSVSK